MTLAIDVSNTPTFTTYPGLQSAIIRFLDGRGEDAVDEFIGYAEDYLRLRLDTVDREAVTTLTAAAAIPLPSGCKRVDGVYVTDVGFLRQVSLADLQDNYVSSSGGYPQVYAMYAGQLYIKPSPTSAVSLNYIEELTRLSDAEPTNWLIDRCPSLYLYAALIHAEAYLRDPSWVQQFKAYVEELIAELNREANEKRWSGSMMPMIVGASNDSPRTLIG